MVTHRHKIQEISIPSWIIQHVEELTVHNRRNLEDGDEPLFVAQFSNNNDFTTTNHEDGIAGVTQDSNEQDDYNDYEIDNKNEDPDDTPGLSLEPAAAHREIEGVPPPENLVELPKVSQP